MASYAYAAHLVGSGARREAEALPLFESAELLLDEAFGR